MDTEKSKGIEICWHNVSLVERFSSVLYPLDVFELLRRLPTSGYVVPDLVLRGTPEENKPLAVKGDVELLIDQPNKTIGIRGRDPERVSVAFEELRQFYTEQLDPSPGLATHYLEFDGNGWAKSNGNPIHELSAFWDGYARLRALSKIMRTNVTNYGLQIAPADTDANGPDWFHVFIEPLVVSGNRYRLRYIWRGSQLQQTLSEVNAVEDTLRKLIHQIESA